MPIPLLHGDASASVSAPGGRVVWNDGAADGDWSNASNWTGGAPGQMDRVYVGTSTRNIDTGLTQTGTTLERLYLGDQWTGEMSVLRLNVNRLVIDKRFGALSLNGRMPEVWIYSTPGGNDAVTLDGTIGDVIILATRGEVVIADSSSLTSLICAPNRNKSIRVSIGSGVTGITNVVAYGNTHLTSESNITTLTADAKAVVTLSGSAAVTTFEMWGDSICHYNTSAALAGSMYGNARMVWKDNTNSSVSVSGWTMYGGTLDLRTGTKAASH